MGQTNPSIARRNLDGPAVATARVMYRRVLASWAQDLMSLRQRGLEQPSFRRGAWYPAGFIGGADVKRADAA